MGFDYTNVTEDDYHTGVDAVKWTLQRKRNQLNNAEQRVQDIRDEVQKIEETLKEILEKC